MTELSERIADFHVRLGRLEEALHSGRKPPPDTPVERAVEAVSICFALLACYLGFGLPNHYYQVIFGLMVMAAVYHREVFPRPKKWHEWVVAALNVLVVSMLLKIVIGGGEPRPFNWMYFPDIEGGLTSFKLTWQPTRMAEWALPLTLIQTFFMILTLFAVMIGFDLLSSLTLFVLIILALPTLVSFEWQWAMPGMIGALFSFFLQGDEADPLRPHR